VSWSHSGPQLGNAAPGAHRSWGDAFNVVMATGIVSIAAQKFGLHVVSLVLLGLAVLAFIPLAVIDALRARQPLRLLRRASAPRSGLPAMGFVAATAVLGTRLVVVGGEGARVIAIVLLAGGAVVWLPIIALVLPTLIRGLVGSRQIASRARGNWLLGVVSTEGLAVLLGALAAGQASALHYAAAVLWVAGGLLYLAIFWLLAVRVRRHSLLPQQFTADLWIVMGAIAIFCVAGATDFRGSTGSALGTVMVVAWGLASAWIPALVAGEVWRIAHLGRPRFAPERWTMVFPLGMYSVSGVMTGSSFRVPWIAHIGHWWFPVALAAWTAVALGEADFAFRAEGLG
jgi:tellurite resistance protein TehA-like permease